MRISSEDGWRLSCLSCLILSLFFNQERSEKNFKFIFHPSFVGTQVVDRTDGKLVHLDGVNFSRAWSLYGLAKRLGGDDGRRMMEMGDTHVR